MTLTRLFAAHVRARPRCFCGSTTKHKTCVVDAFERFLDDLERKYAP